MSVNLNALLRHWVHSHEEDTQNQMVFRPAGFSFPPSRGRKSFELKPGGELVESGIGPTDRRKLSAGTWKLEDENCLAFFDAPDSPPRRVLQIESLDQDRLVVAK